MSYFLIIVAGALLQLPLTVLAWVGQGTAVKSLILIYTFGYGLFCISGVFVVARLVSGLGNEPYQLGLAYGAAVFILPFLFIALAVWGLVSRRSRA